MQTQDRYGQWIEDEPFPFPEPGSDFDPEDDAAVGEWLRRWLESCFDVETDPWAVGLVQGAADRLNRVRTPEAPLAPIILWIMEPNAFTGPGQYVYFSRGLLHRACWEEAVAFTLAHEMAHHDLGHTRFFRGKLSLVRRLPGALSAALVLMLAERWLHGPENEAAADARALDLCLAAGYDGRRCIELFDNFEAYALDHRAIDCVFGPDAALQPAESGMDRWRATAQSWLWHRRYGYPAIRSRKEALLGRLSTARASSQSGDHTAMQV